MIKKIWFVLITTSILIGFKTTAQVIVHPSDKYIDYSGRVVKTQDSVTLYWPGSFALIKYKGSAVKVTMKSVRETGFFYAIIDNNVAKAVKFSSNNLKRTFTFGNDITAGEHTLQLYKLSNNTSANIIYSYDLGINGKLLKPAELPKRKIEFYGNSITAGHGVDVPEGGNDSGDPEFFNNYYTYAAITARHFNAQQSIIARSGIGIMVSWFPEIMPEIYNRIDPMDKNSSWTFISYEPNVVVVNLFQNDYWLVNQPEHPEFKARFGTNKPTEEFIIKSYLNFITSIRRAHPRSTIICALGNMNATEAGSKWPGYIQKAVSLTKDSNIHSLIFPYKNTGGHPNKHEQQIMADQLIAFIEKNIKW